MALCSRVKRIGVGYHSVSDEWGPKATRRVTGRPELRLFTYRHKYYCGIDLHTTTVYGHLTDESGTVPVY